MAREYKLYYGGQWRSGDGVREIRCPHDRELVARCHMGGAAHLNDAVESAVGAFEEMRALSAWERAEALRHIARGIEESRGDLAALLVEEAGKPVTLARAEVSRAAATFAVAAEEAQRLAGEPLALDTTPRTKGAWGMVKRFPLGVIGGITPFNFPLNLVAHKAAPAFASGNCLVVKPASQTPGAAVMLAGIVASANLPKGAFSVVPSSPEVAERMAEDDRVKMLTFTGSAEVGWMLKKKAWRKRVSLELGGNAAVIVHADADVERAAALLAASAFHFAGQSCISAQRVLVERSVYEPFREAFLAAMKKHAVMGDPADEAVTVGPMISEDAAKRVEAWTREAAAHGATILAGGRRDGAFFEPTLLENVAPGMKLWCEEVFGPVAALAPYRTFDEALAMANDSRYGLQAGVFTRDIERVRRAFEKLETGGVIVNHPSTFRVDAMPYGGVKDSGFGREGVRSAIEEMTEPKVLAFA